MKIFLNAGFGSLIGAETLALIRSLNFSGIRQDVLGPESANPLFRELRDNGLFPLLLAHDTATAVAIALVAQSLGASPDSYAVELGNELNLKTDAKQYVEMFRDAEYKLRALVPEIQLVTAGISTTSSDALLWLLNVLPGVSQRTICGYHTYRQNMSPSPLAPQKDFKKRQDEFIALGKIAAGRRIWNTEIGWHTAPRKSCFRTVTLSDATVAEYLEQEIDLNAAFNAEVLTVYQLNDGPTNTALDKYGIGTTSGKLKPSAGVAL